MSNNEICPECGHKTHKEGCPEIDEKFLEMERRVKLLEETIFPKNATSIKISTDYNIKCSNCGIDIKELLYKTCDKCFN